MVYCRTLVSDDSALLAKQIKHTLHVMSADRKWSVVDLDEPCLSTSSAALIQRVIVLCYLREYNVQWVVFFCSIFYGIYVISANYETLNFKSTIKLPTFLFFWAMSTSYSN